MNSLLVGTARSAQRRYDEAWPLAMFESDVATLTWIKEPLAAPNLPKQQLLATSLGLMNPSKHNWSLYISEITRLLDSEAISDNDLVLLRQKYEMDRLAFVSGPSISKDVDTKRNIRVAIEEARQSVTAELTAPMRAEVQLGAEKIGELEHKLVAERATAEMRKAESDGLLRPLLKQLWRRASITKWLMIGGAITLLALALLATFIPGASKFIASTPLGDFGVWAVRAVAVFAALAGGVWGPVAQVGEAVRRRFIVRGLQKLNLDPGRAAEVGFSIVD
jgi:hypothetical protein